MVAENRSVNNLEARGLYYSIGDHHVLFDVDILLQAGEMVGIVGPNGTGKSTLLGLLCGFLSPEQGAVLLNGRPISDLKRHEIAGLIGIVPQTPELASGFSVQETVMTGRFSRMDGRQFENREDLNAAARALRLAGIEHLAGRRAYELSGGERQRLALARMLASEPELLFLDEPTSALDLDNQLKVMCMLERLCGEEGKGVCLVIHDLNLASMFCHRIYLISEGRILKHGVPEQVLRPDRLQEGYGVQVVVDREPSRSRPRVTMLIPKKSKN